MNEHNITAPENILYMSFRRITRKLANHDDKLKQEIENFNPFAPRIQIPRDNNETEDTSSTLTADESPNLSEIAANSTAVNSTIVEQESSRYLNQAMKKSDSPGPAIMAFSQVSIKDAVKVIREFDGENIPMAEFFLGCDEAREMVGPEHEAALTKFIRSKIKGDALMSLQGQSFLTVDALKDHLKSIYVPRKSVLQLQGELGNEYQRDGETVLKFANRIRGIGQRILDAQKSATGTIDTAFRRSTEQSIIECFKRGLQPEILRSVANADDLGDFVKNAIKAEATIEDQKALRRQTRDRLDFSGTNKRKAFPCQKCNSDDHSTIDCSQNKSCTICKKLGHSEDRCHFKFNNCQVCRKPGHTAVQCTSNISQTKCQLCNVLGHTANQCHKNPLNVICQICSKPGHPASDCFRFKNPMVPNIVCQICNRLGHVANDCYKNAKPQVNTCQLCYKPGHEASSCYSNPKRSNVARPSQQNNLPTCNYCKKRGHILSECRKREYNNKMRQGNGQSLPTTGADRGTVKTQTRQLNAAQMDELLCELIP